MPAMWPAPAVELSMKRMMAMMCVATACTAAAAMAQSSAPMDQDKMKHDKMMKGTVMVTGCVADKDSMGHYMLNNAMMSGTMPESTAGSMAPMMSYMLSGGDLKAHVGHKVEVTGIVEKAKAGKMDHQMDGKMKDDKTMADHKMDGKMMDGKMMSDTLKVKSVKMLAASCM